MIELRWLARTIEEDGNKITIQKTLQYRRMEAVVSQVTIKGKKESYGGQQWSEWQTVPTEEET